MNNNKTDIKLRKKQVSLFPWVSALTIHIVAYYILTFTPEPHRSVQSAVISVKLYTEYSKKPNVDTPTPSKKATPIFQIIEPETNSDTSSAYYPDVKMPFLVKAAQIQRSSNTSHQDKPPATVSSNETKSTIEVLEITPDTRFLQQTTLTQNTPSGFGQWDLSRKLESGNRREQVGSYENRWRTCQIAIKSQDLTTDSNARPCLRDPAAIPRSLLKSGECTLQYDVSESGNTYNINIIKCTQELLTEPSINAAKKWYFFPRVQSGRKVSQTGLTTNVVFQLENQYGELIYEVEQKIASQ